MYRLNESRSSHFAGLCWLLSISVPKKSAMDGFTGSFSWQSTHQIGGVKVSCLAVYFLILERICSIASTGKPFGSKRQSFPVNGTIPAESRANSLKFPLAGEMLMVGFFGR